MKKEYIILAIITIALGAYLYFQDSDHTQYTLPQPPVLEDAEISKIEIVKKDQTLVLKKEADEWVTGEERYPVNSSRITPILDILKKIELTALVSESGNYPRYELDEDNKMTVTAWNDDKVVRKIDIGKTASSYRHTFIKLDGNKNVYHAAKNFKSSLDTSEERLVDKTVLKFKPEAAYSLNVTDADKKYAFAKKVEEIKVDINKDKDKKEAETPPEPKEYWISDKGEKKAKTGVEAFIKAFSNLKCDNFVKGIKTEDLKAPVYSVSVTTDKDYSLSVFKTDDDEKFTCTSSEIAFPFNLSSAKIDEFKELFKKI